MQMTMSREERATWERRREKFEAPIIAAALAARRVPVIDYCAPDCPIPPAVLNELRRAHDPDARERAFRQAQELKRSARSLRSLALVLQRKGQHDQAERVTEQAAEREARAAEIEAT